MLETTVIGVGNRMRGDDAVGLEVVEHLRCRTGGSVAVVECDGEPATLIAAMDGVDRAVIVDAVASAAPPGSVVRIDASDTGLPARLLRHSTHLMGIAEAVELARALGKIPDHLVVYGIEAASFAPGADLTPPVADAVEVVVDRILDEIDA